MDLASLFNSGVSFDEFVNHDSDIYKENTLEIFNSIEFSDSEIQMIKKVNKKYHILACAEIWCPDCMINVPVLEKLRRYNENIKISIVGREGNEDLFTTQEGIRIPTFIFYDECFNELGKFVEYPKKVKEIVVNGNPPNIIVAKRKYRKGEFANETLRDILAILV